MRAFLVYPPGQTYIAQPHTSLAYLAGVLKSNGHSVVQRDFGIEAIKFFTNAKRLEESYEFLMGRLEQLEEIKEKSRLSFKQQKEYRYLVALSIQAVNVKGDISDEYEKAQKIIEDKESFFNPKKLTSALNVISYALRLSSIRYYPTFWDSHHYIQRFDKTKVSSMIKALSNKKENLFIDFFREVSLAKILKEGPDLVGISISFFYQLIPGLTLAKMIKEKNKDIHICLGGTVLLHMTEVLQKTKELYSFFDSVILYEGETALSDLLRRLGTDREFAKVPNIIFYNGKKIIKGDRCIEDINSLPSPCYDGLNLKDYISPEKVLVLVPSRGCYWDKCVFCAICPTIRETYRERRPELFLEDILNAIEKYKVRYFFFYSNIIPPDWLSRLSTLIIKNKLSIRWDSEVRFEDGFTEALCRKLYKAGCRYLTFGFESGNQRVLDSMCKGTNLKTIKRVIENCYNAEIGLGLEAFVGFPGETVEEAEDTLNFIISNRKMISTVSLVVFGVFNYSTIFRSPKEFGVSIKKNKSIIRYSFDYKVEKGMSSVQSQKFLTYAKKRLHQLGLGHFDTEYTTCGYTYTLLYADHYKRNQNILMP